MIVAKRCSANERLIMRLRVQTSFIIYGFFDFFQSSTQEHFLVQSRCRKDPAGLESTDDKFLSFGLTFDKVDPPRKRAPVKDATRGTLIRMSSMSGIVIP